MKKILSVLLILSSILLLVACSDGSYCKNGHELGEWVVVLPADCVDDGERYRQCNLCPYFEEDFPKADESLHDYDEWDVLMEATCWEDGEQVHTCQKCLFPEIEIIPATGKHHYVDGFCTECDAMNGTPAEPKN